MKIHATDVVSFSKPNGGGIGSLKLVAAASAAVKTIEPSSIPVKPFTTTDKATAANPEQQASTKPVKTINLTNKTIRTVQFTSRATKGSGEFTKPKLRK